MAGASAGGVDTNALLIQMVGAASASQNVPSNAAWMTDTDVPVSPHIPFYRIGEPLVIPVGPNTANDPFEVNLAVGVTAFQYTNNNPFAVRLCGTRPGRAFVPVTATTGWLWMPGTSRIYTSLIPAFVSAMSVDGPYATSSPDQKAGVGFVELQYGTGS